MSPKPPLSMSPKPLQSHRQLRAQPQPTSATPKKGAPRHPLSHLLLRRRPSSHPASTTGTARSAAGGTTAGTACAAASTTKRTSPATRPSATPTSATLSSPRVTASIGARAVPSFRGIGCARIAIVSAGIGCSGVLVGVARSATTLWSSLRMIQVCRRCRRRRRGGRIRADMC